MSDSLSVQKGPAHPLADVLGDRHRALLGDTGMELLLVPQTKEKQVGTEKALFSECASLFVVLYIKPYEQNQTQSV